jgi:hypothetical protein
VNWIINKLETIRRKFANYATIHFLTPIFLAIMNKFWIIQISKHFILDDILMLCFVFSGIKSTAVLLWNYGCCWYIRDFFTFKISNVSRHQGVVRCKQHLRISVLFLINALTPFGIFFLCLILLSSWLAILLTSYLYCFSLYDLIFSLVSNLALVLYTFSARLW